MSFVDHSQVEAVSEMDVEKEPTLTLPRRSDEMGRETTGEQIWRAFGFAQTSLFTQSARSISATHESGPSGQSEHRTNSSHPTKVNTNPSQSGQSGQSGPSAESTRTNPPTVASLEANPSPHRLPSIQSPKFTSKKRKRFKRYCCVSLFCFFGLTFCIGVSLALFWPRDPSWQLTKLEVNESIMDVVTAMSALETLILAPAELRFRAESFVSNPNLVHGNVFDTSIELRHGANASLVGTGTAGDTTLAPQSESLVVANITLDLEQDFLKRIQDEIVQERWVLEFNLIFASKITTILNVQLQYQMVCDLAVALPDLMMSKTRDGAVTVKACEHSFF